MYTKKINGSFNIIVNGMPYNTIKGDKYYEETLKLYNSNSELFEVEKEYIETLEELKQEKIQELRKKANDYILSQYPYYKQLNIIRIGTEEEKNDMSSFIDGVRDKINQLELDINSCNTEEELTIINYDIYDDNK